MINYGKTISNKTTPQSEAIPGSAQQPNNAGGFSFVISDWDRLNRFLVLGSEGGTYYVGERKLTQENATTVTFLLKKDGKRVVDTVVEISQAGRAPKNDPAIFVLAMAAKLGDEATRKHAFANLHKVCRIGTHLMHFVEYVNEIGGWGRATKRAIGNWYNEKTPESLSYQVVKYQSRDKWSNRDILRLTHPKAKTETHGLIYKWVTKGELPEVVPTSMRVIEAFEKAKKITNVSEIVHLIKEYNLPREAIPTQFLTDKAVWAALLEKMPMTAMIRNLANMTRYGLIAPLSDATKLVNERLVDTSLLKEARVHPIALLSAMRTYASGHGVRSGNSWDPVSTVVSALDEAFYKAFDFVEPANKRTLLALDISGSMGGGVIAGVPGLTPRDASAAMAMVTAATEKQHHFVGFSTNLIDLPITAKMDLTTVTRKISGLPFGGTDCAQPMIWALTKRVLVDTFILYTDSETWHGKIHPIQALKKYRKETGLNAKLIVVGMTAIENSIANSNDSGMLDVVGFDTATPSLINEFSRA